MTVKVLTVCTGNICRSPVAAQLLNRAFPEFVQASSAGLAAVVGSDIDPRMRDVVQRAGIVLRPHVAHLVTERALLSADLVLTMTVDQRGRVLDITPRVLRRSFTLEEFTRLTSALVAAGRFTWLAGEPPDEGIRRLISVAARYRGMHGGTVDDDIADPFREPEEAYRQAFEQIHDAVHQLSRSLDVGSGR